MSTNHPNRSRMGGEQGFSLIDVAVVMAIVGILLAGFLATYKMYQATRASTITEENFIASQDGLGGFVPNHSNRYPRPAPFGLQDGQAGFGEEVAAGDIIPSCNSTNAVGKVCRSNTGFGGKSVLIGLLPFGDLNMPESQARDGYGRYFTYAVSEELTVAQGAMPIYAYTVDTNGDSVINAEDNPSSITYRNHVCVKRRELNDAGTFSTVDCTASSGANPARAIALVSHGSDGLGAWQPSGSLYMPCGSVGANETSQSENCNFDGVFIQSMRRAVNNNGTPSNPADDFELVMPMQVRGDNANKNDDTVQVEVREDANYWGNNTSDISNKYSYKVGIGVDAPTKPLEVAGNIRAEDAVLSEKLCTDTKCLETEAIAGIKEDMNCGELGMVKQIHNNRVECVTVAKPNEGCPSGTILVGVKSDGTADCQAAQDPLCGRAHGENRTSTPPASDRCTVGSDSNFSGSGSGPWSWQCSQSGKTVNCATGVASGGCTDECGEVRNSGHTWCRRGGIKGLRRCTGTSVSDEGCISGIGCCAGGNLVCP